MALLDKEYYNRWDILSNNFARKLRCGNGYGHNESRRVTQ